MPTAVSQLFDRVLTLEEGESIILKFKNAKDLKSKKTMLFREKYRYEQKMKDVASFKAFFIGQRLIESKGIYELKLSTNGTSLDWLTQAMLEQKGGETKPLDLKITTGETERLERLKQQTK